MSRQNENPMNACPEGPQREPANAANQSDDELQPDDFYMDGPYVVFTAAYHLRRGYCCNSGCRHCPYEK